MPHTDQDPSPANLLPAILLAGPPHSGKSVLGHLLTEGLRQAGVQHILLRAAPDGEGAWFQETAAELRFRLRHKGQFTDRLAGQMAHAVQGRSLPMLVDIGGKPQGRQFEIIDACTHAIHLYREEADRLDWRSWIEARNLIPIAELRSDLTGPDCIESETGVLRGVISGLERGQPQPGPLFDLLLARVQGICSYDAATLTRQHLRRAPEGMAVLNETHLAQRLGIVQPGQAPWWRPEHLARLPEALPVRQPIALYGRGPVWLTAAIAAINAPEPVWIFDARHYGWMAPPAVVMASHKANAGFTLAAEPAAGHTRLVFRLLPEHTVLTPQPIHVPAMDAGQGVILDGAMPKWLWSALARALVGQPWLAATEPRGGGTVRFWETSKI
jgi:CRISPR-associated protein Csx3